MPQTEPLAAGRMLAAWEASQHAAGTRRTLLLLRQSLGLTREQLGSLPIGQGDALLLDLRERAFGSRMDCEVDCPACGDRLEFALPTSALRAPAPPPASPAPALQPLQHGGRVLHFRGPTFGDLDACASAADAGGAAQQLLASCLVDAGDTPLDDALADALAERLHALDPQAVTTVGLDCPACRHAWEQLFDICAYFAEEVERWALRTLEEVHLLASHYGWREDDILALTPARRQFYVTRVGG